MKNMNRILIALSVGFLWSLPAVAQDDAPLECDNNFGDCGTPEQSGGGGGGGGSILINNTDVGDTYQFADDYDSDGIEDPSDNCVFVYNQDQTDGDGDGVGDNCDNCPDVANADQANLDGDDMGDSCDDDIDNDEVANATDICPNNPDPNQSDVDEDKLGDACDDDMDGDGVSNLNDNCPLVANPEQGDVADDTLCDNDDDADDIRNSNDNCPQVENYTQDDADDDGIGDACDADIDGDEVENKMDNCPDAANADQADADRDGMGDVCDAELCYVVVQGDNENCLDPTDLFAVYTPSIGGVETGDEVPLWIFANRDNAEQNYVFTVTSAPKGSSATVENASGTVMDSADYQYTYTAGAEAFIVPDQPGTYQIKLMSELADDDAVTQESGVSSTYVATIKVTGDPIDDDDSGCSVAAAGAGNASRATLGFLLLLLSVVAIRRLTVSRS